MTAGNSGLLQRTAIEKSKTDPSLLIPNLELLTDDELLAIWHQEVQSTVNPQVLIRLARREQEPENPLQHKLVTLIRLMRERRLAETDLI